jgi:O-antigen biosynthesis protein WbqV
MDPRQDGFHWGEFLRRPLLGADLSRLSATSSGKTVLLTGAGGSVGSALAKEILAVGPRLLILLEHSEHSLHQVHSELMAASGQAAHLPLLGDVCDAPLLKVIFDKYHPDIVYHAAAFKHVPLMEGNPIAAMRNNALGTYQLALAVIEGGAPRLIMVSTDKAVNPRSIMGASKRVAELVLLGLGSEKHQMSALRLGNILGTQGSVVPLFLRQISQGGPVTVTHPEVRRYFLTLREALELIFKVARLEDGGGIYAPEMGRPVKIMDLADYLIRSTPFAPPKGVPVVFTGLRPGDKMEEDLASVSESLKDTGERGLRRVISRRVSASAVESAMKDLAESIRRRDALALLDVVRRIVPEYQPSSTLLELLNVSPTGAPKP